MFVISFLVKKQMVFSFIEAYLWDVFLIQYNYENKIIQKSYKTKHKLIYLYSNSMSVDIYDSLIILNEY